jgi:tetratricopeptide (TPR) repeat protein
VVVTLLIYAQTGVYEFLHAYDDLEYVIENAHVRRGITAEGLGWAFTTFHAANWHPLTWVSHMLDVELYGLDPGRHHMTNVWLHVVNSLVLFFVFKRMTACRWRSGLVAALFAWHPLHVESVAMIAERKDLLCGFFWLLSMGFYVEYARRPSPKRYLAVCAGYLLGLMSKPMIVTLPIVFLLLDVWPLKRWRLHAQETSLRDGGPDTNARLVYEKLPLLVLTFGASIVTWLAQASKDAIQSYPLVLRFFNAVVSYAAYLGKTVWPDPLAVFYPFRGSPVFWQVGLALVLIIGLTLTAVLALKRRPYVFVGWFWFIGTLVPVIGLVQVGSQAMADRYTYLPLVGIFIVVAWGLTDILDRRPIGLKAGTATVTLLFTVLAVLSWRQARIWSDDATLFRQAVSVIPHNWLAHNNLGSTYVRQGRLKAALKHFQAAIDINPTFADARFNRAVTLTEMGRPDQAVAAYRSVLKIDPLHAGALNNLGGMLIAAGDFNGGITYCRRALQADPGLADAHNNLGVAFYRQGRYPQAAAQFRKALSLTPRDSEARVTLAEVLDRMGDPAAAAAQYELAVETSPQNTIVLARAGAFFLRNKHFQKASAAWADRILYGGDNADAYDRLGSAVAGQGRSAEAVVFFKAALRLDSEHPRARSNLDKALEAVSDPTPD